MRILTETLSHSYLQWKISIILLVQNRLKVCQNLGLELPKRKQRNLKNEIETVGKRRSVKRGKFVRNRVVRSIIGKRA